MEIAHTFTPEQYARAFELWNRALDMTDHHFSSWGLSRDEIVSSLIMSNGDDNSVTDPVEIRFASYSDCHGHTYDRANVRELINTYGFHGSEDSSDGEAYLYLGQLDTDTDVDDALDSLELKLNTADVSDYPVISDDTLSEVEQEIIDEALDGWLGDELLCDVESALDGDASAYVTIEDFGFDFQEITQLFYEIAAEVDSVGDGWVFESATTVYFRESKTVVDRIVDHIIETWRAPLVDPAQIVIDEITDLLKPNAWTV